MCFVFLHQRTNNETPKMEEHRHIITITRLIMPAGVNETVYYIGQLWDTITNVI